MSVNFFGVGGPGQIGALKKPEKATTDNKAEGTTDTVKFSAVLQDVHKAQAASEISSGERADRVQELKAQIKDGSYQPDLNKVSASLLQFLVEGK